MDTPTPLNAPSLGRLTAAGVSVPAPVLRLAAAVVAVGVVAAASLVPSASAEVRALRGALEVVGLGVGAVALAPAASVGAVQVAAMAAVWVVARMAWWEGPLSAVALFGAPLLAAGAALLLPIERPRVRKAAIVVATAALVPLFWVELPNEEHILGAVFQFLVFSEFFGRAGTRPRAADALRYFATGYAAPATPVPVEDVHARDREPAGVLRGASWAGAGLLLLAAYATLGEAALLHPWHEALAGRPVTAAAHGLGYWGWRFLRIAGVFLVDAGFLRMLGMPVRMPFDEPWKATNFLDYWKRANVYRYKMFSDVYFRNFFPTTGKWVPLGMFAVFLVSGLHHAAIATWSGFVFLRWALDGGIAGATAWWRQRRARAGVAAFVAGRKKAPPPAHARWTRPALAVALSLSVLISHGFLMELSRPDREIRVLVWNVFPRHVAWDRYLP